MKSVSAVDIVNEVAAKIRAEGEEEGRVRGWADALMCLLVAREFSLSENQRVRILATDYKQDLENWLYEAITTESVDELLGLATCAEQLKAETREHGRISGMLEALTELLDWRDVPLTDEEYQMIQACRDAAKIETWIGRAATAESGAELIGE